MRKLLVIALIGLSTLANAQITSKEEVAPELVAKREAEKRKSQPIIWL